MSLAQDWPGTAGTHLGHPSLVPQGPAEHGEVTSRWPKQGWPGTAAGGRDRLGRLCGPELAPGRGKDVGMGKEGFF